MMRTQIFKVGFMDSFPTTLIFLGKGKTIKLEDDDQLRRNIQIQLQKIKWNN
jgi:hypothetical protein